MGMWLFPNNRLKPGSENSKLLIEDVYVLESGS